MASKRSSIEMIKMVIQDPMCKWHGARYNWVKQLFIKFGIIKWDLLKDDHAPECFDIENMGTLNTFKYYIGMKLIKKVLLGHQMVF